MRVAAGDDEAGDAILDQEGQPAHLRGDHRRAAGHGFQGDHAKGFVVRGHDQHVGGGVVIGQRRLVALAEEDDQVLQAQLARQVLQAGHF